MTNQTPLYSALVALARKKTLRMHMPGHKGKGTDVFGHSGIFEIDFTELRETGNLYEGIPPISEAEALAAKAAGAKDCFFMTGGSTQAIMTAVATACKPGSGIIIDRASHISVWNAMVHLDLVPHFVSAGVVRPWNIPAPVTPGAVEDAIGWYPEASAVLLTSPSYYGLMADIAEISKVTEKHGVPLIVDEAHGAHLPYMTGYGGAVAQGARLAAASAHKTLPALTPGAFLFSDGSHDPREIRRKAAMFGTSSPSYAVMASMDAARAYMEGEGGRKYDRLAAVVKDLRERINGLGCFRALDENTGFAPDPARITVYVGAAGLSGYRVSEILENEYNVVCEMGDRCNIVLIATCADTEEDLSLVYDALSDIAKRHTACTRERPDNPGTEMVTSPAPGPARDPASGPATEPEQPPMPHPVRRLKPREAAYAEREYVRLRDAAGRVAGEHIAPYPPGIPVVASGEEISEDHLHYLESTGFDMDREISVVSSVCFPDGTDQKDNTFLY
jgi:arginine/lysine/ornithine decarboxylase